MENFTKRDKNLKALHDNKDLWMRLKMYHHDLKSFSSSEFARNRLLNTHHALFMSDCYFSDEERKYLLEFPTSSGLPLHAFLHEVLEGKRDHELCTSHDLAPPIENVFGIRKGYEKEKLFGDTLKKFNKRK